MRSLELPPGIAGLILELDSVYEAGPRLRNFHWVGNQPVAYEPIMHNRIADNAIADGHHGWANAHQVNMLSKALLPST